MKPEVRFFNLVSIGRLTAPMNDTGATPTTQVRLNELQTIDNVQIVHHFGFSSSPPLDANGVVLSLEGDKSRSFVIGTVEGRTRRKGLVAGETVVHDQWGNEVHLSQAGVTVKHATIVTIDAPNAAIKAPNGLRVEGPITCTGEITAQCDGPSVTLSGHKHANGPAPTPHT